MRFAMILLVSLLIKNPVQAREISTGVFGLPAGSYSAVGRLKTAFLPDIDFVSVRVLKAGVIMAKTRAMVLDFPIEAQANLLVRPTSSNHFELLDLDQNRAVVGQGVCDRSGCAFTAKVMKGALTLTERWVPTKDGFAVVDASQNYYGLYSTYSTSFAFKN